MCQNTPGTFHRTDEDSPRQDVAYLSNVQVRYPLRSGHNFVNGIHHCLFLIADTDLPRWTLVKESHIYGNIRQGELLHVCMC